jgi:hypothetical protein
VFDGDCDDTVLHNDILLKLNSHRILPCFVLYLLMISMMLTGRIACTSIAIPIDTKVFGWCSPLSAQLFVPEQLLMDA